MAENTTVVAWLVLAGTRYPIRDDVVRIGRSRENDIVLDGQPVVSARHLEIRFSDGVYRLFDLESTNGTFLNGERVGEAIIEPPASIRLGTSGPELAFLLEETALGSDQTLLTSSRSLFHEPVSQRVLGPAISQKHEELLSAAVARVRRARSRGAFDQTSRIMRAMLGEALHRTSRRFRLAIALLVVALLGVSAYGAWQIRNLKNEKVRLDDQMAKVEILLQSADENPAETADLLNQLDQFQGRAKALESTVLYRILAREREDPVSRDIRSLMAEFGAETYSVPPEFLEQVNRFIQRYKGPDRGATERAFGEARSSMETMRKIFARNNLPPDLAYVAIVESGMNAEIANPGGAAGWWQFTPATARHYGLRVDSEVDERSNVQKSTEAATKYIRDLILDFGAGSSVMLALAAYNLGPAKVVQAIHRVTDPIRQRDFWYLYRTRALPAETREYVPKVVAAMIIARHPEQFGF